MYLKATAHTLPIVAYCLKCAKEKKKNNLITKQIKEISANNQLITQHIESTINHNQVRHPAKRTNERTKCITIRRQTKVYGFKETPQQQRSVSRKIRSYINVGSSLFRLEQSTIASV